MTRKPEIAEDANHLDILIEKEKARIKTIRCLNPAGCYCRPVCQEECLLFRGLAFK